MSHFTSREIEFLNWALNTRNELPKILWEGFSAWLEAQSSERVQVYGEVMESWLDEFPEIFPSESKVTRKAFIQFDKQINAAVHNPTPEDEAAFIQFWNETLPHWKECFEQVSVGDKGRPAFASKSHGWECRAPKEKMEEGYKLWRKTAEGQRIAAQSPFSMGYSEKPAEMISEQLPIAEQQWINAREDSPSILPSQTKPAAAPTKKTTKSQHKTLVVASSPAWGKGDRVFHAQWGKGAVKNSFGSGKKEAVAVQFDTGMKIVPAVEITKIT